MMKVKNVLGIIYLVIFFLFANHAWASDWLFYSPHGDGDMYYDKSSIKKVNKNIIRVWTKMILNEDGKTRTFLFLKNIDEETDNPDKLSRIVALEEIDCKNKKTRQPLPMNIYDTKGNIVYSYSEFGEWVDIIPDSVTEELKNIVCSAGKTSAIKKK